MPFSQILLGAGGIPVYPVVISTNRATWQKSVDGAGIPSNSIIILQLTINSAIEVQSVDPLKASLIFDSLFAGSEVYVINNGYAIGDGGDGNASIGGHGIRADFTGKLKLTNAAGSIRGGGGGGGQGGDCAVWVEGVEYEDDAGGGGGGGGAGGGGAGAGKIGSLGPDGSPGIAGTSGPSGIAGAGGASGHVNQAGVGGAGGAYGVVGVNGTIGKRHGGPQDGSTYQTGQVGGTAGFAIKHNAGTTIEWISGQANIAGNVGT